MAFLPYIVGGILLLIVIWFISAYNGFIKLRNQVEEAFATMDVYLKKRYDLIPNIVETVKGYAKHEAQTLENVVAARNMAANATTTEGKVAGENTLQSALKSLFAIAEAYPDLKANSNFISLQAQLSEMEGEIANARKYYNAVVKTFNTKVEVFPSNIIAKLFNFTRKTMFEVEEAEQRQNVNVQF
jgi:LemA protein